MTSDYIAQLDAVAVVLTFLEFTASPTSVDTV